MADVTITAANVAASANAVKETHTAGDTITAGMPVYVDTSDNNHLKPALITSATASVIKGIALHGASDGQPLTIAIEDPAFTPGFTTAVGTIYIPGGSAGTIAPSADAASLDYVTVLMIGTSTSVANLKLVASGAVVA